MEKYKNISQKLFKVFGIVFLFFIVADNAISKGVSAIESGSLIFLGFSSLLFFLSLLSRAFKIHQKVWRILLVGFLIILGMISLSTVSMLSSTIAPPIPIPDTPSPLTPDDSNALIGLITSVTGILTAISGIIFQLTARKKAMLEIELEKQKLAFEREKFEAEKKNKKNTKK